MPQITRQRGLVAYALNFTLVAVIGAAFVCLTVATRGIFLALVLVVHLFRRAYQRRRERLKAQRGDSICDFARSFDCRVVDTWIVRAVYEEVSRCVRFPVHADDKWKQDLRLDAEEFEELATEIAHRAGRSLESTKQNPLYSKIISLRHLVEFLNGQPKRAETTIA